MHIVRRSRDTEVALWHDPLQCVWLAQLQAHVQESCRQRYARPGTWMAALDPMPPGPSRMLPGALIRVVHVH